MNQVFKGQTSLVISLDTGLDLSGATETKILFQRPNGTKGEWTATVSTTILQYQTVDGDIDSDGMWNFQAYAVIGGKKYYGQIQQQFFSKPIK